MKKQIKTILWIASFLFAVPFISSGQSNKPKEAIWNRNDIAIVLIDYQPEQINGVHSGNKKLIELNAKFVAKIAKAFNIPVVLSTVGVKFGINRPTIDSIKNELPGITEIDRSSMDSWQDANFRDAIKKTGKKKLVMIGLWTEICLTFPTVDALANGYQVMILTDAIGGTTLEAHQMAIQRMIQAGAIPNTTFAFAAEMNPDWADPAAQTVKSIGGWYMEKLAAIHSTK